MIRIALVMGSALLVGGVNAITASSAGKAMAAEPQQALAILLKQLGAKPLGLYDGVRLLRINKQGGGSLTVTVSCEREQWRIQNSDNPQGRPSFYDAPFLAAKGISRTWVCTGPARVLE
ncbi:hypothetical protein [Synechococcus sp. BS56D]|uniref:hypothetical protein n=1 Tax=Synechococcus sp. BS56D TaxID=2055944 RepID=UPI001F0D35F5|nr:hypothetical protein [Synechococcus sp. BS56D]